MKAFVRLTLKLGKEENLKKIRNLNYSHHRLNRILRGVQIVQPSHQGHLV
jgi:hypothetical protein